MAVDQIDVTCPTCGKRGTVPLKFANKSVRCKSCGHSFVVQPLAQESQSPAPDDATLYSLASIEPESLVPPKLPPWDLDSSAPPRRQPAPAMAAVSGSGWHYMLQCINCGFTHHIPCDHDNGPIRFYVDMDQVEIVCIYGTFKVTLRVKEFFTITRVSASGLALEASIGPNMKALHAHILPFPMHNVAIYRRHHG